MKDSMPAVVRPDGSLMPMYPDDVKALGVGEVVNLKISIARNYHNLKRFFALINACWELEAINEHFGSPEELRAWITVQAGHCDTYHFPDDVIAKVPKSISYRKMGEVGFTQFYNRAVNVVLQKFLPTYKPDDFNDYIDRFIRF